MQPCSLACLGSPLPLTSYLPLPPLNSSPPGPGPLEATIANLQREIAALGAAGRELQRRWIGLQGQLVAAQAANAEAAEAVAALRSQQAVMQQKRERLNAQ